MGSSDREAKVGGLGVELKSSVQGFWGSARGRRLGNDSHRVAILLLLRLSLFCLLLQL